MNAVETWMMDAISSHILNAAKEFATWLPTENPDGFTYSEVIDGTVGGAALATEDTGACVIAPFGGRISGRLIIGLNDDLAMRIQGGEGNPFDAAVVLEPVFHSLNDPLQALFGGPLRITEIVNAEDQVSGFNWTGAGAVVGIKVFDGDVHVATLGAEFQVALVAGDPPSDDEDDHNYSRSSHPSVEFEALMGSTIAERVSRPLDLLHDVELQVTVELGRTRMTVRDLLSLAPGSVVELDRAAGSPIDLLVNGTLIARGEVVVIDEEFGIRVMEIIAADNPIAKKMNH